MTEKRLRFIDAEWAQDITFQDVILGGIGGIGSWLALLLSRVNVRSLLIFENDIVNFHNIGGQLYGIDDVGKSKYDSLIKTILNFSAPVETSIFPGRRLEKYMLKDASNTLKVLNPSIVFSAFDNMSAREMLFNLWLDIPNEDSVFIDGRMGAESFQVFTVKKDKDIIERYKASLFSDEEVPEDICTLRATTHNGMTCASVMLSSALNFITNLRYSNSRPYDFELLVSLNQLFITRL